MQLLQTPQYLVPLEKAEPLVPELGNSVQASEARNSQLTDILLDRELRIKVLTHCLAAAEKTLAIADQAMLSSEHVVRGSLIAISVSEEQFVALSSELATLTGAALNSDNDIAQLSFALAIANASAVSREVLCSQVLCVTADSVSLAEEVLRVPVGCSPGSQSPLLSLSAYPNSPLSLERSHPQDVSAFSPSPPHRFLGAVAGL